MRELTSRQFNNGAVMTYHRGIGVESKLSMYKEYNVYHLMLWDRVKVSEGEVFGPHNAKWITIEGPYAYAKAIKAFRLAKRYVDSVNDLKFIGVDV